MSLGELVVELGIKGNIKPLQDAINKTKQLTEKEKELAQAKAKVAQQIDKGIRAFRNITASITASVWAINKLSDALLNNNQHWINLLRQSNITLESFQKYGQVANILDRSLGVENATQSLQSLEQQLYKLQLTGEGASGFLLAGINPMGKSTEQVIEDIRSRISGMDDRQATFLLNQMGIDPRMLGMLRLSRQELEAINNELKNYRLTEEQRNALQEYNKQLEIARTKLRYYKDRLILAMIPIVTKLTQATVKLIDGVMKFIQVMKPALIFIGIVKGLPLIIKGITLAVEGLKIALLALVKHPAILAWTALFAGLYLILEDIMVWASGGNAMFGYLLGAIDDIVADDRVPQWMKTLWDIISHADKLKGVVTGTNSSTGNTLGEEHPVMLNIMRALGVIAGAVVGNVPGAIAGGLAVDAGAKMAYGMYSGNGKQVTINQNNVINTNETANDVNNQMQYALQTAN